MITHLLDTNVLSHYARGQFPVLSGRFELAVLSKTAALSVVTRAEVMYGIALMDSNDKRRNTLPRIIDDLPNFAWQSRHADAYADIDARLKRRGQTIGVFDAMIAAHALVENLILVTHNVKHFERIPNLKIEDWTQA